MQKNKVAHSLWLQPCEGALRSPTSTTTDYYKPYTIQKNQVLNDCNLQKRSNDESNTKHTACISEIGYGERKKERNEPRDHLADDDDNGDVPQKDNDHNNNNEQASNVVGASTRILLIQSLILLQKSK